MILNLEPRESGVSGFRDPSGNIDEVAQTGHRGIGTPELLLKAYSLLRQMAAAIVQSVERSGKDIYDISVTTYPISALREPERPRNHINAHRLSQAPLHSVEDTRHSDLFLVFSFPATYPPPPSSSAAWNAGLCRVDSGASTQPGCLSLLGVSTGRPADELATKQVEANFDSSSSRVVSLRIGFCNGGIQLKEASTDGTAAARGQAVIQRYPGVLTGQLEGEQLSVDREGLHTEVSTQWKSARNRSQRDEDKSIQDIPG
ncbi:hypothetical protein C8T65DRAFT_699405 [Cerioporus squamosus]|nr:hypothetical protein C8T65DRAFT_699405 [Cerioporus squamosus]